MRPDNRQAAAPATNAQAPRPAAAPQAGGGTAADRAVAADGGAAPPSGEHRGRERLTAHLAMLAFAALIAGSYSVGDLAADSIDSGAFNALRFLLGAAVMGGVAAGLLRGRMQWLPAAPWRFLLLGALMAVYMVTQFVALGLSDPVSTGAVFTLMPLMTAGFGFLLLGQTPRPAVLFSLVLAGFGAVWVIFRGDLDALLSFDIGRGEAIFFVGCICHGAYAPLVRRLSRGEPVVLFTFHSLAGTALCISAYGVGPILATDWASLPGVVWLVLAYLTICTTVCTTFLLQYASLRLPASKVLAYTYLTPTLVILYEGLAGHGWPSPGVLAGAAVTMLALAGLAATRDA